MLKLTASKNKQTIYVAKESISMLSGIVIPGIVTGAVNTATEVYFNGTDQVVGVDESPEEILKLMENKPKVTKK